MQHKCKVTVIDKKIYPDLQREYLAEPQVGECPFYQMGQEFVFERYAERDDFWTMGRGSQCAEAWDCISRYIYTALQNGSPMRGWSADERVMIACCNDGTRLVIFKIERIDYLAVYVEVCGGEGFRVAVAQAVERLRGVNGVAEARLDCDGGFIEVLVDGGVDETTVRAAVEVDGSLAVVRVE